MGNYSGSKTNTSSGGSNSLQDDKEDSKCLIDQTILDPLLSHEVIWSILEHFSLYELIIFSGVSKVFYSAGREVQKWQNLFTFLADYTPFTSPPLLNHDSITTLFLELKSKSIHSRRLYKTFFSSFPLSINRSLCLKTIANSMLHGSPSNSLRPICWAVLTSYLPSCPAFWQSTTQTKQQKYKAFLSKYYNVPEFPYTPFLSNHTNHLISLDKNRIFASNPLPELTRILNIFLQETHTEYTPGTAAILKAFYLAYYSTDPLFSFIDNDKFQLTLNLSNNENKKSIPESTLFQMECNLYWVYSEFMFVSNKSEWKHVSNLIDIFLKQLQKLDEELYDHISTDGPMFAVDLETACYSYRPHARVKLWDSILYFFWQEEQVKMRRGRGEDKEEDEGEEDRIPEWKKFNQCFLVAVVMNKRREALNSEHLENWAERRGDARWTDQEMEELIERAIELYGSFSGLVES